MIVDLAEVTLEDLADCVVVVVRGQLDLATLEPLYAALAFAYQDRAADLVVDFEGVTFCGAETLRLLSDTAVRFSIGGRRLVVRGAQPAQARLFGICRLEHLLTPLKKVSWAEPGTS